MTDNNGKFVYVINELNSTVTAFAYNPEAGTLKALQSITTLPKGFKEGLSAITIGPLICKNWPSL